MNPAAVRTSAATPRAARRCRPSRLSCPRPPSVHPQPLPMRTSRSVLHCRVRLHRPHLLLAMRIPPWNRRILRLPLAGRDRRPHSTSHSRAAAPRHHRSSLAHPIRVSQSRAQPAASPVRLPRPPPPTPPLCSVRPPTSCAAPSAPAPAKATAAVSTSAGRARIAPLTSASRRHLLPSLPAACRAASASHPPGASRGSPCPCRTRPHSSAQAPPDRRRSRQSPSLPPSRRHLHVRHLRSLLRGPCCAMSLPSRRP